MGRAQRDYAKMFLHLQPDNPAHLVYGVKFLHLPLYRGDGDCAVEGLLSTQIRKEEVAKERGKKTKQREEEQMVKNRRLGKENAWSPSLEKPEKELGRKK